MPSLTERPAKLTYVLRVGAPPQRREQLQIAAALLQGAAVVVVPRRCDTVEEWLARYGSTPSGQST